MPGLSFVAQIREADVQGGLDLPRGEVSGWYDSGIHVPFGNIKMRMVVADFLTEVRFSHWMFDSTRQFPMSYPAPLTTSRGILLAGIQIIVGEILRESSALE